MVIQLIHYQTQMLNSKNISMKLKVMTLILLVLISCNHENNLITRKDNSISLNLDFYSTTSLSKITLYKNKIINGNSIDFYRNGNIELISSYKNGKLNGLSYYYYPSGYIKCIYNFENNLIKGNAYWYYDSSIQRIKIFEYYELNKLCYRKFYNKKGVVLKEEGINPLN